MNECVHSNLAQFFGEDDSIAFSTGASTESMPETLAAESTGTWLLDLGSGVTGEIPGGKRVDDGDLNPFSFDASSKSMSEKLGAKWTGTGLLDLGSGIGG